MGTTAGTGPCILKKARRERCSPSSAFFPAQARSRAQSLSRNPLARRTAGGSARVRLLWSCLCVVFVRPPTIPFCFLCPASPCPRTDPLSSLRRRSAALGGSFVSSEFAPGPLRAGVFVARLALWAGVFALAVGTLGLGLRWPGYRDAIPRTLVSDSPTAGPGGAARRSQRSEVRGSLTRLIRLASPSSCLPANTLQFTHAFVCVACRTV